MNIVIKSEMASYINLFLKTEITAIPSLLDKYAGKYYNNTLCNGATWMVVLWYILHVSFDQVLNAIFKKMRYKEHARIRLTSTLWHLGFYTTCCVYCTATLLQNNVNFYEIEEPLDGSNAPKYSILGFVVLVTFYLHSALWELLKYDRVIPALSHAALFLLLCFSYFFEFVQGSFRLITLISSTQVGLEIARLLAVLGKSSRINCGVLALSIVSYFINYLLLMPLLLAYSLYKEKVIIPFLLLTTWLILEIPNSVLAKAIFHVFHKHHRAQCDRDLVECSLFPAKTDATSTLLGMRREIWKRQEQSLAARKPKSRGVMMQTLKCMVAIKRKLKQKRQGSCDAKDETNDGRNFEKNLSDGDVNVVDASKCKED